MNTLVELINTPTSFGEGKLRLKPQAPQDHAKLDQLLPHDQVGYFRGARDVDGSFVFERVATPAPVTGAEQGPAGSTPAVNQPDAAQQLKVAIMQLRSKTEPELQEEAALLSVQWDKSASRDTMIERIAKASLETK
jgi:hypothetical protein